MSSINNRLKELRASLGLSQTEFGKRIGYGRGVVKNFDENTTTPNSLQIDQIVKEYKVNREWLETGEGEMFAFREEEEILTDMFARLIQDSDTPLMKRIITGLVRLSPEERRDVENFIVTRILGEDKKEEEEE